MCICSGGQVSLKIPCKLPVSFGLGGDFSTTESEKEVPSVPCSFPLGQNTQKWATQGGFALACFSHHHR